MIGDETPAERAHPDLANLCIDLRALKVPCDGWSPAADAVGEIKRLRSQLSQVTRERDEAREEAARVRLLGESDSRELLKAETSRDAAEATLREAREAFGVFIGLHLVSHGLPQARVYGCPTRHRLDEKAPECTCGLATLSRLLGEEGKPP